MDSSHTAALDIPELNKAASVAHIFPTMENNSLLFVGQLCNEGYYVTFKIDSVTIFNSKGYAILKGIIDLGTGLWCINLRKNEPQSPIATVNNVYELRNTGALVNYLHKALLSPKKSALLHAVKKGNLITWPGLTEEAIHKHLKLTPATAMGQMNKKRQNISSTNKIVEVTSDLEDVSVTPVGTGDKTNLVYAVVIGQCQLYTDLTGRFPVHSSKGNWYIMIIYSYDCNYIKPVAMKSRSASEWVRALGEVYQ
jgi:hypothetical protein